MGTLKNFRFPSLETYSLVAKRGRRLNLGLLSLRYYSAPDGQTRFCFVVKKKNGNAAFRNRCRRVLRPIFFNKQFTDKYWIMVFVEMDEQTANWAALKEAANKATL